MSCTFPSRLPYSLSEGCSHAVMRFFDSPGAHVVHTPLSNNLNKLRLGQTIIGAELDLYTHILILFLYPQNNRSTGYLPSPTNMNGATERRMCGGAAKGDQGPNRGAGPRPADGRWLLASKPSGDWPRRLRIDGPSATPEPPRAPAIEKGARSPERACALWNAPAGSMQADITTPSASRSS